MSSTFFPHKMRLENVKEKNPIIISCACSLLMITSSCKKKGGKMSQFTVEIKSSNISD